MKKQYREIEGLTCNAEYELFVDKDNNAVYSIDRSLKEFRAERHDYNLCKNAQIAQKDPVTIRRHLQYLEELSESLKIEI